MLDTEVKTNTPFPPYLFTYMLSENSETLTFKGFSEYTLLHFTSSFKTFMR